MPQMRYRAALRAAHDDLMKTDDRVIVLGQDVGRLGGSFAVTKGLLKTYGPRRVIETPISESAIIGAAAGMALMGRKPIAELMFADFITLGMDHIVNTAAKAVFASGGVDSMPLVVRAPYGSIGAGMHHDQSPEAWIANVPGLKIAVPATPADAGGMLKSAVADPNPVIFMEHKGLYGMRGDVIEGVPSVPLGKARIARKGRDLTIVTFGAMVRLAESVAAAQAENGVEIEVVDLRSLRPLDMDTVLSSVRKTGRAIVLQEAPRLYGVGGEIAAQLHEDLHDVLKAPVLRLGSEETPIPQVKEHRAWHFPDVQKLSIVVDRAMTYGLREKV